MYTQLEHLDVSDKMLQLSAGELYKLDLRLPYPVFGDRGGAKFDKQKRVLTITIPVQPPPPTEPEVNGNDGCDEPGANADDEPDDEPTKPAEKAEESCDAEPVVPPVRRPVDHSRWLE